MDLSAAPPIVFQEGPVAPAAHRTLLAAAHPRWSVSRRRRVLAAFKHSQFVASAYADKTLVGIVRVFTDSVGFALLADLLVHPAWRHHGIATSLLKMATDAFADYHLYADVEDETLLTLYEQAGFARHTLARRIPH